MNHDSNKHESQIKLWATHVEAAANTKGWSRRDAAEFFGISIGYYNRLMAAGSDASNNRTPMPSFEILRASAELQNISVVSVLTQVGLLEAKDFYYLPDHEEILSAAYDRMNSHPELCSKIPTPSEWAALSINSRYGLVILFEIASKELLIRNREKLEHTKQP